ncbi:hypothetical protein [Bacillus wiedmannii]|jgi:hypothetical protein|uniref:hypothetical protein n=1 Tax=Bacillus wiedmannii TaxID=1890302 RepID=UPI000BEF5AB8|nr:hypothetical protein [Bacillus wiedmannii]MCU5596762.1 hypothetical protein [Bacillus wiedmannii]PEO16777.1 hypothetical protein CN546_14025 [Bacillus wiedmannii]
MNKQLEVKTSYLVMLGNVFLQDEDDLVMTKEVRNAVEYESTHNAKRKANEIGGVVVRKTIDYEEVQND